MVSSLCSYGSQRCFTQIIQFTASSLIWKAGIKELFKAGIGLSPLYCMYADGTRHAFRWVRRLTPHVCLKICNETAGIFKQIQENTRLSRMKKFCDIVLCK